MTFVPLLNCVIRVHLVELTYSSVPESASQFNSLQQDRFGFFEAQIATQAKAKTHGTKAGRWDLDVSEGECLDHICEIRYSCGDSCKCKYKWCPGVQALYVILPLLLLPLHTAKLDRDYARYRGDNAHFQLSRLHRSAVRILWPMSEWELVPCSLNAMQCLLVDTGYCVTPVKSVHADFGMASAFYLPLNYCYFVNLIRSFGNTKRHTDRKSVV